MKSQRHSKMSEAASRSRLEFLRDRVDILTFCAQFAHFRPADRQLRALCPIHSEQDPSFYISQIEGTGFATAVIAAAICSRW